jgi:hypothetical protein
MKTWLLVATVGLTGAHLVSAQEFRAGKEGTGKPYTVTVGLRQEYDDNINTTPNNEQGSFKTIINPGVVFRYPLENTLFSAGYNFGATYYWDRPGDDWDLSHLFNARINHKFSPRFEIDLREQFRFAQESELRNGVAIQRRLGDGWANTASIQGIYQWTERFSTSTTYTNEIQRYDETQVAFTNDYIQHNVSQDFLFSVLPTTTAVLNYTYVTTDYDEIDRDFDSHRALVGADHYLLPTWLLSGRAGAEFVFYDNPVLNDAIGPYVNVATVWNYLPGSSVKAGYTFGTNLTDDPNFGSSVGHTVDFSINHAITQKFSVGARTGTTFQTFEQNNGLTAAVTQDIDEQTFFGELTARYAFTEYLSADAGYRHSFTDSDNLNREYWRNQVWIGITGKY